MEIITSSSLQRHPHQLIYDDGDGDDGEDVDEGCATFQKPSRDAEFCFRYPVSPLSPPCLN